MAIDIGRFGSLRLWRIWNFFIIIFLYAYLIYDSIFRYISFKRNSMDVAFGSNYYPVIMNVYLMSIIFGMATIALSLYCLIYNNGNYGDNGMRLGRDTNNMFLFEEYQMTADENNGIFNYKRKKDYLLKRFGRHFLPFSCLLHYFSALSFLLPLPFVEAHQINQRVMTPNNLWHTDLDFLFDPDSWHQHFIVETSSTSWFLRPQYFNLILSLTTLSVRYASVFWACHRGFSFIFSLLMVLSALHILLDYSTTSIIVRVINNPEFISQTLRITFVSASGLMTLSLIGSSIIVISFWCVFEFGFQQFMVNVIRYRHLVMMQSDSSHDGSNLFELSCSKRKHLYLRGYLPHLAAVSGVTIAIGMKIPIFYASIDTIYKLTGDPITLTHLLITILFFCSWLIAWFGFSLKPNWKFILSNCPKTVSDYSSTTTIVQPPRRQATDQVNQIYSCFHNFSDNSLQSRLRNRDYYSDEADLRDAAACTNYVYLQSAMNPGLNQVIIQHPVHNGSPLVETFIENQENRNAVSDSESSYDSATNIRNQIMATVEPRMGRSQSQNIRNIEVLKYSGDSMRSYTSEYIPLQSDMPWVAPKKLEKSSSLDTNTLHAADSEATLKYSLTSSQQPINTISLTRQNSNKKRMYGQRVTFKDVQVQDTVDCSPNNSEQSSNNTTSSDSGIDSNSKQIRNPQNFSIHNSSSDNTEGVQNVAVKVNEGVTSSNFIPTSTYSAPPQSGYNVITVSQGLLGTHSLKEDISADDIEDHSMSYISEDDQEQRLCSQV